MIYRVHVALDTIRIFNLYPPLYFTAFQFDFLAVQVLQFLKFLHDTLCQPFQCISSCSFQTVKNT